MKRQKKELNNFRQKTREQGGQQEGFPGPEGNPLKTTPGEVAARKKRNPRWTSVTKTPTRELKRIHGACKGINREVEEELRRRGCSTKMLAEIQWEWGQRQWCKAAKRASKISTARNAKARWERRRSKRRRWRQRRRERSRERLRQNRIDLLARLKTGVVIVGEKYDAAAADGNCPF
jgi:hypothetical protein